MRITIENKTDLIYIIYNSFLLLIVKNKKIHRTHLIEERVSQDLTNGNPFFRIDFQHSIQ
jgi:hypothetical protein